MSAELLRRSAPLPARLRDQMGVVTSASRDLREGREVAFYGDEQTGTSAESLFSEADAGIALTTARRVLEICRG